MPEKLLPKIVVRQPKNLFSKPKNDFSAAKNLFFGPKIIFAFGKPKTRNGDRGGKNHPGIALNKPLAILRVCFRRKA
jgi:hypothetical protein